MTSKNIDVQETCDSSIESTVPEHLDAGINNGDDSVYHHTRDYNRNKFVSPFLLEKSQLSP